MFTSFITFLNRLAHGKRFRKFWGTATEVFWIDKVEIYEFPLPHTYIHISEEQNVWRTATLDDVNLLVQQNGTNESADFLKCFVNSSNEYLLIGIENDVIQTYAVCAVVKKRMNGQYFHLETDEAFISVCYTRPDARGKGWYPACISEIVRRCEEQNIKRVFIDIATYNTASIRGALKAGAVKTDSYYWRVRIWKRDRLFACGKYKDRLQ